MGRPFKYLTNEERVAAKKEQKNTWRKNNKQDRKIYYKNNKNKYIERANLWRKLNPEKYKQIVRKGMKKYNMKLSILKKIEKIGEAEWIKVATDAQLETYIEDIQI